MFAAAKIFAINICEMKRVFNKLYSIYSKRTREVSALNYIRYACSYMFTICSYMFTICTFFGVCSVWSGRLVVVFASSNQSVDLVRSQSVVVDPELVNGPFQGSLALFGPAQVDAVPDTDFGVPIARQFSVSDTLVSEDAVDVCFGLCCFSIVGTGNVDPSSYRLKNERLKIVIYEVE